jgi:acetoacetyl-CoA reductase
MTNTEKKIALITGGVGGIGTGISKTLAAKGYFVVANYIVPGSDEKWHDEMLKAGYNGDATATAFGDVSDYDATGEMVKKIEADIGPIDVLVNCAGITRDATLRKMSPDHWHAVLSTNLYSVFNTSKHVIDGMVERGWGRIINISSVNGIKGQFGQTNYAAAKAGVLGFTKSLAQEVIRKGVTVNAVSPGYIDTDMTRAIRDDVREQIVESIPAGRMGYPDDIANAIAFLASDESSYITGANISVNGGLHMYA